MNYGELMSDEELIEKYYPFFKEFYQWYDEEFELFYYDFYNIGFHAFPHDGDNEVRSHFNIMKMNGLIEAHLPKRDTQVIYMISEKAVRLFKALCSL